MNQDHYNLYRAAIKKFGADAQTKMAIEEMAELMNALMKFDRDRASYQEVAEEIADVKIMLEQLIMIYTDHTLVDKIVNEKLWRLDRFIREGDT